MSRLGKGLIKKMRNESSLVLIVGHGSTGKVALLHVHSHATVLHSHHLILLLGHVWSHLSQKFLLLILL
jgi:hypothetical protein